MSLGSMKQYSVLKVMLFALICVAVVGCMMMAPTVSYAAVSADDAHQAMTEYVAEQVKGNEYETQNGGYVLGEEVFTKEAGDGKSYDVDDYQFSQLTNSAQKQLAEDIVNAANDSANNNVNKGAGDKGISEQTVQSWMQQLQTKNGFGSQILNAALAGTKPDFVTAQRIWEPFSGVVGTILALVAIIIMALLGVTMVLDIAYITIPAFRLVIDAGGSDDKGPSMTGGSGGRMHNKEGKSMLISHEAIRAVEIAENGDSDKHAIGIYLKRRIWMLLILGLCLVYLVQGQIYVFVGWFLDLLNGFLGF